MFDSLEYITTCAVQTGKTRAISLAAQSINGTVITANEITAKTVRDLYGVPALSIFCELRGTKGPYLVDTHAVSCIVSKMNNRIYELERELNELKALKETELK